ncbi:MAG TPA: hypothetical protein VFI31_28540 [Pirellulales bacterium]|nr:hypothetical protein [Pirellulales bacterium]
MDSSEMRRAALAKRLRVAPDDLRPGPQEGIGSRFELQPGGYYCVYSPDEEKQAFKTRVPDVPFVDQIRDGDGKTYNVYLAVENR